MSVSTYILCKILWMDCNSFGALVTWTCLNYRVLVCWTHARFSWHKKQTQNILRTAQKIFFLVQFTMDTDQIHFHGLFTQWAQWAYVPDHLFYIYDPYSNRLFCNILNHMLLLHGYLYMSKKLSYSMMFSSVQEFFFIHMKMRKYILQKEAIKRKIERKKKMYSLRLDDNYCQGPWKTTQAGHCKWVHKCFLTFTH